MYIKKLRKFLLIVILIAFFVNSYSEDIGDIILPTKVYSSSKIIVLDLYFSTITKIGKIRITTHPIDIELKSIDLYINSIQVDTINSLTGEGFLEFNISDLTDDTINIIEIKKENEREAIIYCKSNSKFKRKYESLGVRATMEDASVWLVSIPCYLRERYKSYEFSNITLSEDSKTLKTASSQITLFYDPPSGAPGPYIICKEGTILEHRYKEGENLISEGLMTIGRCSLGADYWYSYSSFENYIPLDWCIYDEKGLKSGSEIIGLLKWILLKSGDNEYPNLYFFIRRIVTETLD